MGLCVAASEMGCATIIKGGGAQPVYLQSSPTDANVEILDARSGNTVAKGRTPMRLPLAKSTGYFVGARYRVLFDKPGFDRREVSVDSSVSGWYIVGNFFFGGLIGWFAVDPATGAMWNLDPDTLNVTLYPARPAAPPPEPVAAALPQS